ncbi:site-specific integrase [Synergistaceae bacterium OttesenSCG-928-I11]|nr:site-specific integrase [Synergistaceae bacterium OttesenSCG-928-I11]
MQYKLTQSYVQNLKPKSEPYRVRDTVIKGLMVIVNAGGKKSYFLDYNRLNGKKSMYRIGDATLFTVAEARDMARNFLADLSTGKDPTDLSEILTLRQLVENIYGPWLLDNRKAGKGTLEMIKFNFEFLFDKPIDKITIAHIEQWRTQRKKKDGVKSSSLNRVIGALQTALNWAIKRGMLENNPLAKLERLTESDTVTKVRYLTEAERGRLMKTLNDREIELRKARESHNRWCKERDLPLWPVYRDNQFVDHMQPLILMSLYTGIRKNSMLSLIWDDINFEDKMILVRAATAKNEKQYYVPMNEVVFRLLTTWKNQSKRTSANDLVFPSPKTGKKMNNCDTAWESLLKKAEIENFRWHDMRHDFASQLVMSGVDLNTVRELMGHADLKMTLRYAHLAPEIKKRAVDNLERIHINL